MTRRRRAALLGGLALLLGGLAASDVGGREAALRRRIGPTAMVLVARDSLPAGARLTAARLAVRQVPERWAPAGAFSRPADVEGLRTAVAVPTGADVVAGMVDDGRASAAGAPVRPGERVADVIAVASPELVQPGVRVDVLVTRGSDDGSGRAELALEDVEVLAARPAPQARADDGAARVAASLRVTLRQAVYLAAAQSFAREIRLLPRAAGDDRRGAAGLAFGSGL
jgi:pilus assembly protein CpaB